MIGGFQRKKWTSQEQWILRLLLDGETNLMESLRRQLEPPFFCRVHRHPMRRGESGKDGPARYRYDIVFNEALLGEFSVGDAVNLEISDLRIRDQRVEGEIRILAKVRDGVITEILAETEKPVSWPKYLRADDWWFVLQTQKGPWRSKRRQSLEHLGKIVRQDQGSAALLDLPVARPIDQRSRSEGPMQEGSEESRAEQTGQTPEDPEGALQEESVAEDARRVARSIAADPQAGKFEQIVEEITSETDAGTRSEEDSPTPTPLSLREQGEQETEDSEALEEHTASAGRNLGLDDAELQGLAEEDEQEPSGPTWANDDIRSAVAEFDDGLEEETPVQEQRNSGLSMSWVESFVNNAFDSGQGVDLGPPARKQDVEDLRRASPPWLPGDLAMFLTHADGANLWGVRVLSCHDILSLEEEEEPVERIVFALAQEGGSYSLKASGQEARSGAAVFFLPRKSQESCKVADDFRSWLDYIEQQVRRGRPH